MKPLLWTGTDSALGRCAGVVSLALAVLAAGSAAAGEPARASRDEVQALTVQAAQVVAADCALGEARERFMAPGEFLRGEVYVNVIDTNGTWRIYPPNPRNVGKSVLNAKDQDGRFLVQDIIRTAAEEGEGWVSYRWLNPATNRIEDKDSYVKAVPACGLIVYIGAYR